MLTHHRRYANVDIKSEVVRQRRDEVWTGNDSRSSLDGCGPLHCRGCGRAPRLSNQRGPRSGPAGVQPLRGRLELCIPGLYGPTWPSGIVGKVRHRIDRKPFVGAMTGPWGEGLPRRHVTRFDLGATCRLSEATMRPAVPGHNRSDRSASLSLRFSASS